MALDHEAMWAWVAKVARKQHQVVDTDGLDETDALAKTLYVQMIGFDNWAEASESTRSRWRLQAVTALHWRLKPSSEGIAA